MKLKLAVIAVMFATLAASTLAVSPSAQARDFACNTGDVECLLDPAAPAPAPAHSTPIPVSYEGRELYLEAESGSLTSVMEISHDDSANAYGGGYISATSGENTSAPQREAEYSFSLQEDDTYYLWARLYGPDKGSDAMYIGIDGSWNRVYPDTTGQYVWVRVATSRRSDNYGFSLSSGVHSIQVGHGELNARLDALYLTSDTIDPDSSVPPDAEHPQGRIAFSSDRGGYQDIHVMDADGSNQVNLTNDPAYDEWPTWSPDGSKIAFLSRRDGDWEIYAMNADGSNRARLTNGGASLPAWSPDGSKIAFTSNGEIYVMNADGSNQRRLTSGGENSGPVWSPDGSKIAFGAYENDNYKIYVMNADGSNQVRLTNNSSLLGYTWSPDGSKIAFNDHEDGGVFVMDADGSNQARLTGDGDYSPLWSPDGSKIAFVSGRDESWEIYMMNADGSNQVNLTNNPASDWVSSWSPDGSKIAFVSDRDGNSEVYVMDADGSNPARLTVSPGWISDPSWSPARAAPGTPDAFKLHLEAEDGNLTSNMEIGQDGSASGGAYISATSTSATTSPKKEASYSFSVPEDGTYYLWARLYGPDEASDAIYIGIDGSWNRVYPAETGEYLWVRVETSRNSDKHGFSLGGGQHEIQVGHGEAQTRLDALVVTDDLDFHP